MGQHTTKKFSFRLSAITKQQAGNLKKVWRDAKVLMPENRLKFLRKNGIVGIIPIRKDKKYHWLNSFFKKNRINLSQCDIFISMSTRYDTRVLALPDYVMKVIRETGADITFSFTVV